MTKIRVGIQAVLWGTCLVGGVASCSTDKEVKSVERSTMTESKSSPSAKPVEAAEKQDPDIAILTITTVDIDTRLAAMCGIPESKVFFKYDSAKLLPEAKERLEQIATCAVSGPAKGKELLLVGRTGPVGSDEYNKQLGMSRAESVATFLREHGVAASRVETESKGEAAAAEAYPLTWPYDRRVTIRLQP